MKINYCCFCKNSVITNHKKYGFCYVCNQVVKVKLEEKMKYNYRSLYSFIILYFVFLMIILILNDSLLTQKNYSKYIANQWCASYGDYAAIDYDQKKIQCSKNHHVEGFQISLNQTWQKIRTKGGQE